MAKVHNKRLAHSLERIADSFLYAKRYPLNAKIFWILSLSWILCLCVYIPSFAQEPEEKLQHQPQEPQQAVVVPKPDIAFDLDVNSQTIPLPKIFSVNLDLSGRGWHPDVSWPRNTADPEIIERLYKEIGFRGLFRIQWDFWQMSGLNKQAREELIKNYERLFQKITDSGGTIILNLYGTPNGMGILPDRRSPVRALRRWRVLVRELIRRLSCQKKYNIWYELWNAPDLESFFLGTKEDYLNLYRFTAIAVRELERKYRMDIPLGGPSTSWWFQNFNGNSIISPEKSLIYELIKFTAHYKLPLDFISWHGYSQDPRIDNSLTGYNKKAVELIREWLTYFNLDPNIPLIIDEWNFDPGRNVSVQRAGKSNVAASYILPRIYNMYLAGLDNQIYFALQDFQDNKEGVVRNLGIFSYEGRAKAIYNVLRMLNMLEDNLFVLDAGDDEFMGMIAAKSDDNRLAIISWNYIDPQMPIDYLSGNIATLNKKDREQLLDMFNTGMLDRIFAGQMAISDVSASEKLLSLLQKGVQLNTKVKEAQQKPRTLQINISNLKGKYAYRRFSVDSSCSKKCAFSPVEKKEIDIDDIYQEIQQLDPYSVNLVILQKVVEQPKAKVKAEDKQE